MHSPPPQPSNRQLNLSCKSTMKAPTASANDWSLPKAPVMPSREERARLALMLTRMFKHWQLPVQVQCNLLGLNIRNRTAIYRYRRGSPLPESRDQMDRVGLLLGIHARLQLLFPQNRELAYAWMTRANRAFGGQPPVIVAGTFGIAGLHMVGRYLDAASVS
jgi:hypothetical protein